MIAPEQLEALGAVCARAQVMNDAGIEFVYLEKLKVRSDEQALEIDALLRPGEYAGYTTRLFLSQPVPTKANNWSIHQFLGRAWHTWSWQGVPADLPLIQMLMCHLDALR